MLSAALDRHGGPERENGWRDGGLPELFFRDCQALRPVIVWSQSQGRGSVERALAGRPSGSASERASSFEILWQWGLWKRRKGKVSEDMGEDLTEEPKHAPRPGQLPLCLRKAESTGTGLHLEVTWLHPNSQAERQGPGHLVGQGPLQILLQPQFPAAISLTSCLVKSFHSQPST